MLGACWEHCFASYRSSDRSLASRSTDCITLPARSPTGQVDRRKASEPVHVGMARCGARPAPAIGRISVGVTPNDDAHPEHMRSLRKSATIVTIVRSRPIVPIVRPRLVVATSGRVGGWFNHRTAWLAELCSISPQARHDTVHIGDLRAAQPPDVRRAGHLLFRGSSILLRKRHILRSDAATDRNRKAHVNSMHSHAQSLFGYKFRTFDYFSSRFKINAA